MTQEDEGERERKDQSSEREKRVWSNIVYSILCQFTIVFVNYNLINFTKFSYSFSTIFKYNI